MVRISTCFRRHIPCLIPFQMIIVKKDSHKLCNCHCRMCVVHLKCCFLVQLANVIMVFHIFIYCQLKACRYEEILLFETKFFSCVVIVIWIQYFYDCLRKILLLHSFVIVSTLKRFQLEIYDRLCIPDTKCIDLSISVSYDRIIIWYCQHRIIVFLFK